MSTDDMKDTREKLVEAAEKLSAYVEGMDKLTEYVGDLWKEIEAANSTLGSAAKENQLKNTADALEKMNAELKALKSTLANFSDRGSLVRQRIEKVTMMTAEIRDIDTRVASLCKSFNRLNRNRIADLVAAVGRFEVTSNEVKGGLKYLKENVHDNGDHLKRINKKLSMIEMLKSENDALDRRIKARILEMDNEKLLMFKRRITGGFNNKTETIIDNHLINNEFGEEVTVQESMARIEVGDEIIFGRKSGCDLIWRVLEKNNNNLFLLSKYGITKQPYNKEGNVAWQDSSLRKYLNDKFIREYFDVTEGEMIKKVSLAGKHWKWDKKKAEEIGKDKVFLLGGKDLGNYFTGRETRICYGLSGRKINMTPCEWWLRGTSLNTAKPTAINAEGEVNNSGNIDSNEKYYVRPVMWIEPSMKYTLYKVGEKTDEMLADLAINEEVTPQEDLHTSAVHNGKSKKLQVINHDALTEDIKANVSEIEEASNWYYDVKIHKVSRERKKGEVLAFGNWHGQQILWRVLCRRKNWLFLISLFGFESMQFHEEKEKTTWGSCSLRRYLNTDFIQQCFSGREIERLTEKSIRYNDAINDEMRSCTCRDKVYILSADEIQSLDESEVNLKCLAIGESIKECEWWLRTPGRNAKWAAVVSTNGKIKPNGRLIYGLPKVFVRPVICINAEEKQKEFANTYEIESEEKTEEIKVVKAEAVHVDLNDMNVPDVKVDHQTMRSSITSSNRKKTAALPEVYAWYKKINRIGNRREAKAGDVLMLGSWMGELLLWKVIEAEEDRLMLLQLYALPPRRFNEDKGPSNWGNCSLRDYLNGVFLEEAFATAEKELIILSEIEYMDYLKNKEGKVEKVKDKIFVPSVQELATGFWANELACRPLSRKDGRGCEWWLRDRGNDNRYAAVVGVGGGIGEFGRMMSAVPKVNVRPAMWIRR